MDETTELVGSTQACSVRKRGVGHQYLDRAARSRAGVYVCCRDAAVSALRPPPTGLSAAISHGPPVMRHTDGWKLCAPSTLPTPVCCQKDSRLPFYTPLATRPLGGTRG